MGSSLMGRLLRWVRPPDAPAPVADVARPVDGIAVANDPGFAESDALWGEGFLWPGGEAEIMRLAAPLGLSAAHSLLLAGRGAGGPARAIAGNLGVWVSAYELDPALVEVARRRIQRAGASLAKRAKLEAWAPALGLPARGFHHAMLLDVLEAGDPVAMLAATLPAVKPGGQVVIVQSLDGARGDALGRTIEAVLAAHGCDTRIVENESNHHARLVLAAWRGMVRRMHANRPPPAEAARLVEEAARWLYRLRDIREGRMRVMRWVAITPPPG